MIEELNAHAGRLADASLRRLFRADPDRARRLAIDWGDWRVDYSKERIDDAALAALVAHAVAAGVPRWIEAQFAGERVNLSEGRPALHTALRQQDETPLRVDGQDVLPAIRDTRRRVAEIADRLRSGRWTGATGQTIRRVINLGIGGSDLGPRMAVAALGGSDAAGVAVDFVANVDPAALARALRGADAASTLFVVTSKTFTTLETLANAREAQRWLSAQLGRQDLAAHFVGVTANAAAAQAFGIASAQVLPMWDWVGGRYSLWSAAGLPIAVALGPAAFDALCAGAAAMDAHVRGAPPERNVAVVLGALAWWNARWMGVRQRLVVPYAQALDLFPAFLQQLVLESNGKRVTRDGSPCDGPTAIGLWGAAGTDAQHSFFQWLHQGTQRASVEFVVPVRSPHGDGERQRQLVANALAQAQALLAGRQPKAVEAELAGSGLAGEALAAAVAARACPGDRPSSTLMLPVVDAWNLGALVALWEHRTCVEAALAGTNPFDQWGVELGKTLAKPIAATLVEGAPLPEGTDASTAALAAHARRLASG
ncbi:MAG: glucose-6-phosphate isomerase [Betaproteobacteria bacterium]|nr:glucose-6-phosphate isomerase [Betaproteobacteria bacterium]MDH5286417.1 glucose-6-phosphate isomerase [Betaproteobacteria bacterium]